MTSMRLLSIITLVITTLLVTVSSSMAIQETNTDSVALGRSRSNILAHSPLNLNRRLHSLRTRLSNVQRDNISNSTDIEDLDDESNGKEIMSTVVKRRHKFRGKATFYHGGAMACGGARAPGQIFAAMSTEMFQGGKRCGATVTVKDRHNHRTVTVTILDECPGCARTQLDLSQGAFDQLGSENTGVLHIKWWFD